MLIEGGYKIILKELLTILPALNLHENKLVENKTNFDMVNEAFNKKYSSRSKDKIVFYSSLLSIFLDFSLSFKISALAY